MDDRDESADEIFMDALLDRVYRHDEVAQERRVDGALERLRREHWRERRPRPRARVWALRLGGALSAAAAALLVGLAVLWSSSSAQAMEAVERSIAAMSDNLDRRYAFVVETERRLRTMSARGDLYVRGTGELAIRAERGGADLWIGEDADESWAVPVRPFLPVLTGPKGAIVDIVMPGEVEDLPLLRMTTALERLRGAYDLDVDRMAGGVREVSASLSTDGEGENWPDSIVFRAEDDGVVTALEMRWSRFRGAGARAVTLELVDAEPKPDDFYGHAAHHDGRPVVQRR